MKTLALAVMGAAGLGWSIDLADAQLRAGRGDPYTYPAYDYNCPARTSPYRCDCGPLYYPRHSAATSNPTHGPSLGVPEATPWRQTLPAASGPADDDPYDFLAKVGGLAHSSFAGGR